MLRFDYPALLLLAPLLWSAGWLTSRLPWSHQMSTLGLLPIPPVSHRHRLRWLPGACQWGWQTLLAVALAGPRYPTPVAASPTPTDGPAAVFVVDVSGSMALPTTAQDQTPRLQTLQRLFDRLLQQRPDLAVGLVRFSSVSQVLAPITHDHVALRSMLGRLTIDRQENRTNVGDGIALAADLLQDRAGSGFIVLGSDGAPTIGPESSAAEAGRIATALGLPIIAVSIGEDQEFPAHRQAMQALAKLNAGHWLAGSDPTALEELTQFIGRRWTSPPAPAVHWQWRDAAPVVLVLGLACWSAQMLLRRLGLRTEPATE